MRKITTAEALAAQIQDGATIAISGNGGGMVEADHILSANRTPARSDINPLAGYWRSRLQRH